MERKSEISNEERSVTNCLLDPNAAVQLICPNATPGFLFYTKAPNADSLHWNICAALSLSRNTPSVTHIQVDFGCALQDL